MADITIIGGDKVVREISARVGRNKVNHVVKRNAAQLQQKAQRYAAVDTGFMKRSIMIEVQPQFLSATIKAMAEYSAYVEYGTRYMGAQPYMRPARNEQAPIFLNDLKKMIRSR